MDGDDVRRVVADCAAFLEPRRDDDWSTRAPDLDMTAAEVLAHVAQAHLWYTIDLAASGDDLEPYEPRVDGAGSTAKLLALLRTSAEVLATVIDSRPPGTRGFHPFGMADPSGFAAMACDETMVHTHDMAGALGTTYVPPADDAAAVLARLFPWVDAGDDPWASLLWANGRIEHEGRARLAEWKWHCAPLSEWTPG